MDIKIGDTIYLDGFGNAARDKKGLRKAKITKIGRKYVYASLHGWDEIKIDKDCMIAQDRGSNAGYYAYTDVQDYLDRQERHALTDEIQRYFRDWTRPELPLDALRQIKKILDENTQGKDG